MIELLATGIEQREPLLDVGYRGVARAQHGLADVLEARGEICGRRVGILGTQEPEIMERSVILWIFVFDGKARSIECIDRSRPVAPRRYRCCNSSMAASVSLAVACDVRTHPFAGRDSAVESILGVIFLSGFGFLGFVA